MSSHPRCDLKTDAAGKFRLLQRTLMAARILLLENLIEKLQSWYSSQCNDVWEHSFGIEISNIDNPGWKIKITGANSKSNLNINIERSDTDWIVINADDTAFQAYGGSLNLQELLETAAKWLE